ncbi:hypothetical protein F5146DRAFT_1145251 [Armillaria mellea]|nr:hypothetical protein F5146DRAFT_1145251 [Armillaria mellea]
MTTGPYPGTAIPELTKDQIKNIFLELDYQLNSVTLNALTHRMYTGVVAVTLWAIASREKPQNNRRLHFLVLTILILHLLGIVTLYGEWSITVSVFITNNGSFWMAFNHVNGTPTIAWIIGMTAILSTILADVVPDEALDMALLDCLGSVMVCCAHFYSLHYLGVSRGIVSYYNNVEDTLP